MIPSQCSKLKNFRKLYRIKYVCNYFVKSEQIAADEKLASLKQELESKLLQKEEEKQKAEAKSKAGKFYIKDHTNPQLKCQSNFHLISTKKC